MRHDIRVKVRTALGVVPHETGSLIGCARLVSVPALGGPHASASRPTIGVLRLHTCTIYFILFLHTGTIECDSTSMLRSELWSSSLHSKHLTQSHRHSVFIIIFEILLYL